MSLSIVWQSKIEVCNDSAYKYVNSDEFLKMLQYDDFNKTLKLLSSEIDPAEIRFIR